MNESLIRHRAPCNQRDRIYTIGRFTRRHALNRHKPAFLKRTYTVGRSSSAGKGGRPGRCHHCMSVQRVTLAASCSVRPLLYELSDDCTDDDDAVTDEQNAGPIRRPLARAVRRFSGCVFDAGACNLRPENIGRQYWMRCC
jgi:hypothetical protein